MQNYKENNYQCIEYWKKRFPSKTSEELEIMRKSAIKKALKKRPNNEGVNNPSHSSKVPQETRKKRSPMCIEFWRNKYPDYSQEKIQQLYTDFKIKLKKSHTPENTMTRVEYWLSRGYSEEEARKKIYERYACDINKYIKKYGEVEGRKKFNERQIRWQKTLRKNFIQNGYNGIHQSKFANNIISKLKSLGDVQQEYNIDRYSFDARYKNKLIEFNGDYWHMNPIIYKSDDINKTNKKSAQFIWDSDKHKYEIAKSRGFEVLVIWESEYKQDPINTINKCIQFLYE